MKKARREPSWRCAIRSGQMRSSLGLSTASNGTLESLVPRVRELRGRASVPSSLGSLLSPGVYDHRGSEP
jgi:hypothetical protein